MKVKITTRRCIICNSASEVEVDKEQMENWRNGMLVQKAFPNMSAEDRELLITGTHPECWVKLTEESGE